MKRKQIVDLSVAICLIVMGSILLIFPLLNVLYVKYIFMGVLVLCGIINLVQFILTSESKDIEGLLTMGASIITLILVGLLDIEKTPLNMAIVLFVWITLMSIIKLKKCDYYHDRHHKIWVLKMITLLIFIIVGLLSVINLYYDRSTQLLVLGYFFFTHGILELTDPITVYLLDNK